MSFVEFVLFISTCFAFDEFNECAARFIDLMG